MNGSEFVTYMLDCRGDGITFEYNDETTDKATLTGSDEVIRWETDSEKEGYIVMVLKRHHTNETTGEAEYFVSGILLIRMVEHKEYDNVRLVPECYMFTVGIGLSGEYVFDDGISDMFIAAAKRIMESDGIGYWQAKIKFAYR